MLSLEDKFEIVELINLYGHILDRKAFDELGKIFTDEAVFDLSGFASGNSNQGQLAKAHHGLSEIVAMMTQSDQHPVAHHATNIVIDTSSGSDALAAGEIGTEVRVQSKGIGVGRNGRVGSVVYQDVLVKYERGWRICLRKVQLLTEPGQQL